MNHNETFYVYTNFGPKPVFQYVSSGTTQPPPYRNALPYSMERRIVLFDVHDDYRTGLSTYSGTAPNFDTPEASVAYNKAYENLKSGLGDPSQWANNLLEMGDAMKGVIGAIGTVRKIWNATKRADPRSILSLVSGKDFAGPQGRSRKFYKSASDRFLAYHFGWSPLCQDIYNAAQTLTSEPPWKHLRGRASSVKTVSNYITDDVRYYQRYGTEDHCHFDIGVNVRISNPNAFLANQLGFANPAAIAWEAVPFSFVVDWFANVGEFLGSMTDFFGLELSGGYSTRFGTCDYLSDYFYNPHGFDGPPEQTSYERGSVRVVQMSRVPGNPPSPRLTFKPFKGFSPTRGATACALLLQQLR